MDRRKKIVGGRNGYSAEGKKLYRRMCWIFGKIIELDEWKDVWMEYWKDKESNYIVPRKRDRPVWNTFDESKDEEGCYGLFDDNDEDFTDGGHAGEVEMEPV